MKKELQVRAAICEVGRRLWQRGLVSGTGGAISARLGKKKLIATPGGACVGHLKPDDLVTTGLDGKPDGSVNAGAEINVHLSIYRRREDCMAIVHAQPPTATGFAVGGEEIPDNVLPEAAEVLGSVPLLAYGGPGSEELEENLAPLLDEHKTFMLSHHGALALGNDVYDAGCRMESLENVTRILMTAKLAGETRAMPSDAFDQLLKTSLNGRLD